MQSTATLNACETWMPNIRLCVLFSSSLSCFAVYSQLTQRTQWVAKTWSTLVARAKISITLYFSYHHHVMSYKIPCERTKSYILCSCTIWSYADCGIISCILRYYTVCSVCFLLGQSVVWHNDTFHTHIFHLGPKQEKIWFLSSIRTRASRSSWSYMKYEL